MIRHNKYHTIFIAFVLTCLSFQMFAQETGIRLTGIVSGENGVPVPNVSISIEGLLVAPVLTDTSGEFEINAPDGNVWLLITPISKYKALRIYLNNREALNIKLIPFDRESIYDEITTIKGIKAKRNILGSHEAVSLDATIEQPNQTITQYLAGQTSGLLVYNHSGMPGDGSFAFMRGIRSLHSNNQPLVIADGVPVEKQGIFRSIIAGHNYDPLISIDAQDITGLTVLKDLEGTSNYGLKSSNGIILIETLKPTETRTSIDFFIKIRLQHVT